MYLIKKRICLLIYANLNMSSVFSLSLGEGKAGCYGDNLRKSDRQESLSSFCFESICDVGSYLYDNIM